MAVMEVRTLVRRIAALPAEGSNLRWAVPSVVVAVAIMGLIGIALEWRTSLILIETASIGISTVAARSLARAFISLFAAIALIAALLAALIAIDDGLPGHLGLTWVAVAYCVAPITVGLALCIRKSGVEASYGGAEFAAAALAFVIAVPLARRVNLSTDLLTYVLRYEDNAAWVSIVTQINGHATIGPGLRGFGPLVATLLGILSVSAKPSAPPYNAVFSAFMFLALLTPFFAAGCARFARHRSVWVVGAFAFVVGLWALHVPFELYATYGHLTAVLAFLALLGAVALAVERRDSPWLTAVIAIVAYAVGASWFPIIPLAVTGLALLVVVSARSSSGRERVVTMAIAVAGALLLLDQLLVDTLGVHAGGSLGAVRGTLTGLYAAQGGTAALDAMLQTAVLVGIAAIPFLPCARDRVVRRPWVLVVMAVLYTFAVYAGANYLQVGAGYGPTKLWYVVGWAVVVFMISIPVRLSLPAGTTVAILASVLLGSMFYGGASPVVARTFYGTPDVPDWLVGATTMAAQERRGSPHPLACFANDNFQTYRCTRWAASLSNAGDTDFVTFRLQVVGGADPSAEIRALAESGILERSWILLVDDPDADHAWAWSLVAGAQRVYGRNGEVLDPRPTPPAGP